MDADSNFRDARRSVALLCYVCEQMKTSAIIEGMTILEKYREKPDGYNCGAEHDVIYVYATPKPLEADDLNRLVELGWFQEEVDYGDDEETGGDFAAKHYDPEEGWTCYT